MIQSPWSWKCYKLLFQLCFCYASGNWGLYPAQLFELRFVFPLWGLISGEQLAKRSRNWESSWAVRLGALEATLFVIKTASPFIDPPHWCGLIGTSTTAKNWESDYSEASNWAVFDGWFAGQPVSEAQNEDLWEKLEGIWFGDASSYWK